MPIAWLTAAGLHVRDEDGRVRHVESAFAQSVRSRHQSIHRRNAWKTGSEGRVGSFGSGDLLWGTSATHATIRTSLLPSSRRPGSSSRAPETAP